MISKTPQQITTAAQLLAMPDDGNRYELVRGVLNMMSPAGSEHGRIAGRIYLRLANHVEQHRLGETYAAETGFRISSAPDTVRAPDAAFVSHSSLSKVEATSGYLSLAPDLVVEVVSPNDSYSGVEAKAHGWLKAGTKIVLVADPANTSIAVYENESEIRVFRPGESYDAGKVCGGWKLSVSDAFNLQSQS
jgi:Uma2 family endonuclease